MCLADDSSKSSTVTPKSITRATLNHENLTVKSPWENRFFFCFFFSDRRAFSNQKARYKFPVQTFSITYFIADVDQLRGKWTPYIIVIFLSLLK